MRDYSNESYLVVLSCCEVCLLIFHLHFVTSHWESTQSYNTCQGMNFTLQVILGIKKINFTRMFFK